MVVVLGGSTEESDGVSTPTCGSANQRQGLLLRLDPLDLMRLDLTNGMLQQGEKKKIAAIGSCGRKGVKEDLRPIMMARLLQTGRPPLLTRRSGEGGCDAGGRNAPVRDRDLPAKPGHHQDGKTAALKEINNKKEDLFDLIADTERRYNTGLTKEGFRNTRMLQQLAVQIEPRPNDPLWYLTGIQP
ncbi:hypothetical protein ZWY2020_037408 [Hordeum vulgare]|nr:hypothetical protein ZWY2020_037408 [Hordeum vulgare]